MNKKRITFTLTFAITAAAMSVAGCTTPTAKRAMTEAEWQAAWQTTYEIKNYTIEGGTQGISNSIKVTKADFENGNYELPELIDTPTTIPLKTKIDANTYQVYGEAISSSNSDAYNKFSYISLLEDNVLYSFNNSDGDWKMSSAKTYASEHEAQEAFNSENTLGAIFNKALVEEIGISFENSYSDFTYDSTTDAYSGTLTTSYGDKNNLIMNATLKFTDGKLSEFAHNSIFFYALDDDAYSLSRIKYVLKLYDVGTTEPITNEEMAMLKELIT